jgi:amino acid permease
MMDRQRLFKIWVFVVIALLIVVFYESVSLFDFGSIAYWIRLTAVLAVLTFTFYIVYTKDNKRGDAREKWYADELKRRDSQIEDLRTQNSIIMKTSLKQSENAAKWGDYAKRLEEQLPKK